MVDLAWKKPGRLPLDYTSYRPVMVSLLLNWFSPPIYPPPPSPPPPPPFSSSGFSPLAGPPPQPALSWQQAPLSLASDVAPASDERRPPKNEKKPLFLGMLKRSLLLSFFCFKLREVLNGRVIGFISQLDLSPGFHHSAFSWSSKLRASSSESRPHCSQRESRHRLAALRFCQQHRLKIRCQKEKFEEICVNLWISSWQS